jgi:hypothetical protein
MTRTTAHVWLALVGATAVIAFFLPFFDVGGLFAVTGLEIVMNGDISWFTRTLVALVPVGGITIFGAAVTGSRKARPIAGLFGLGVLGYLTYQAIKIFVATTGLGMWLVIAAALAAIVICASSTRQRE